MLHHRWETQQLLYNSKTQMKTREDCKPRIGSQLYEGEDNWTADNVFTSQWWCTRFLTRSDPESDQFWTKLMNGFHENIQLLSVNSKLYISVQQCGQMRPFEHSINVQSLNFTPKASLQCARLPSSCTAWMRDEFEEKSCWVRALQLAAYMLKQIWKGIVNESAPVGRLHALQSDDSVCWKACILGCFTKTLFQKKKLVIPSRLPIGHI